MQEWRRSQTFREACTHAFDGIRLVHGKEHNMRRQSIIGLTIAVVAIGLWARSELLAFELAILVVVASLVLALEMINSAIEEIENVIHPEYHSAIKRSKDIAAGAVFVSSVAAVIVGLLILGPPIARLLV